MVWLVQGLPLTGAVLGVWESLPFALEFWALAAV